MKNILTILISTIILGVIFFGCKKDEGPTATGPITVNGFVKDYYGQPVSGAAVIIAGKTPVTTTASGTFSIPNVTIPYDISLIVSATKTAVVYKGLSRSDPKLFYLGTGTTVVWNTANISGTVPPASGKSTRVIFVGGTNYNYTTADQATGNYSLGISWRGTIDSLAGKIYVLRYTTNPSGLPIDFDAYGSKGFTVRNGVTHSSQNFSASDLSNPSETTISGTIVRSADYTLSSRALYFKFDEAFIYFGQESTSPVPDNFSYIVPSITGITCAVAANASKTSTPNNLSSFFRKTGIAPGTSGVNIKIENAPSLALPLHNSTNVDTLTDFTWSQGGGDGVNLVEFYSGVSTNPTYYIFTMGSSLRIPNFSALALGLPANTAYIWRVYRYLPVNSIDNAASDTFRNLLMFGTSDYGNSYSQRFNFTTKP